MEDGWAERGRGRWGTGWPGGSLVQEVGLRQDPAFGEDPNLCPLPWQPQRLRVVLLILNTFTFPQLVRQQI